MSLYLKYRPNSFESLVGQDFVKETLKKAVANDKLVGAYLFCGPRGTGKTSSARILAKSINCLDTKDGIACNKCEICNSFNEGKLIDIIEIDAASHTGVDNIREIIERAQFSPTKAKYKIYIIDEVHMLSTGAFNALLKILEEPPKHLKFILATTESHKVPETIISRCQRYDFKRITDLDIKNRLEYIAKQENIKTEEKALNFIVKNSGGGLRNAISLLEQYTVADKLDYDNIVLNLGLVTEDIKKEFLEKLINKDSSTIDSFNEIVNSGINLRLFIKDLIFLIRDKLIEEVNSENKNTQSLISIIDELQEAYIKSKNTFDENLLFTITFIKIISGYKKEIINNQTNSLKNQNTQDSNVQKIRTPIKNTPTVDKKEEISTSDIDDIFGDTSSKQDISTTKEINTEDISDFNLNSYITKLKELGAKGGLTMALRGSSLSLTGKTLTIKTKTQVAKNQVTNIDNNTLLLKGLEETGISNPEISVN